jgi:hypothetical protein
VHGLECFQHFSLQIQARRRWDNGIAYTLLLLRKSSPGRFGFFLFLFFCVGPLSFRLTLSGRLRFRSPCTCHGSRIPPMPPGSTLLPLLWGTPLVLCLGARYISGPTYLLFPRTGVVRLLALPPPDFSPGVFVRSRLPFHSFLHIVPSLLQVRVRCPVPTCFLQGCRFALFEFGLCFLRSVRLRGDKRHFCVRTVSDARHYFFLHRVPSLLQVRVRCLVPTCFLRFALSEFGRCFLRSITIARRQEALLRACCVRCLAFVVCDVSSAGDFGGREVPARSRSSCPLAVRCLC